MSTPHDVRKSVARARSSAETLAQLLKELEGMLPCPVFHRAGDRCRALLRVEAACLRGVPIF